MAGEANRELTLQASAWLLTLAKFCYFMVFAFDFKVYFLEKQKKERLRCKVELVYSTMTSS